MENYGAADDGNEAASKTDSMNTTGEAQHPKQNEDVTSDIGTPDDEKMDDKQTCVPVNEPSGVENLEKNADSTTANEKGTSDEKKRGDKQTYDPVNEPSDVENLVNNADSTTANEKGTPDKEKRGDKQRCDSVNEPSDVENLEKNADSTTANEKGTSDDEKRGDKQTCDPVNEPNDVENLEKNADSTTANEKGTPDKEKRGDKQTCDPVNEPSDVENLEKNADSTTGNEKGTSDEEKMDDKETCDPVNEPSDVEILENADSNTANEKGTSDEEKRGDKETCDPVNEPSEVENLEKNVDSTTANEKGTPDREKRGDKETCDPVNEPSVENLEKNADSTTGNEKGTSDEEKMDDKQTCDPVNEPSDVENLEKNADSTTANEKGTSDEEKIGDKETCDPVNERSDVENLDKNADSTTASEKGTSDGEKMDDKETCDPVNERSDAENLEKNVDSTAANEKGTSDEERVDDKQMAVEVSEEITREKQHQAETEALLGRLHLQDKRQQKLTQADFLKIGPPMKQHHDTSEKDLDQAFLGRLMMLDYRARHIPVRRDSPETTHLDPDPVSDIAETDDYDFESFLMSSVDSHQIKQTHVHPMDVQMAVFHCSDNFLKQSMITKLSQCQYALPLLVPDPVTMDIECPLWTFRQITKSWKVTQASDGSHAVSMNIPICKAQTPLVSFFRLGSLSLSKSELMNTLINERHSTFFHRNHPGSTKSRHLMDGVAEIAWYCPAGKPSDAFNDCIAFCNLHGDALLTEKQRDILTEKSSVNVVLVPTLHKDDKSRSLMLTLFKSQKPLICLIADDNCDVVKIKGKYKLGLKERSMSDISEQLKKIIGECLSSLGDSRSRNSFQLETMAEVPGIRVDERDLVCQKGKSAAMKIVTLLKGMDVSNIKDKFLPCQGHLWHEWCRIKKALNHLKGHIEKDKCEKKDKLKDIRKKQCDASCSKLMELFIESLSSLPPTDKEYFLKWMQILMDDLSTDSLSSILQSYDETWSEVLDLKNKPNKFDQLLMKQMRLEDISKKLQSATFGLEHIFREMGQIYEAHFTTDTEQHTLTDWSKYPELAAQLMISRYPVELMDGDAGHVPLTWISSLLREVINKLGDQRVFVLSVLGLQSSGKSTMLNAMFGLQFAVSAGRCTKGAFMQLVKVSEELKKDLKFDYVLVVDTEGLRALESAGNAILHHDDELATFVVGLGNMTLINIFGENSAEMQDVLQIVVQAFMRMKKVKLSPSCVFVHQNVTDVAAAEKNIDGKRHLQEKLDQMAQLAAKEEGSSAESFSDIIEFDVLKDMKYCSQLWEGSPPMAPPNPGYCDSIQELKSFILSKASKSDGITLSQFSSKVQDLWNALLKENFVFSFKNTLEIAVYRNLEVQYGNWTWVLRSNMLTIENQFYNRLENGMLDRIELNFLYKEMSETYEEINKAMTMYFADDRNKDILAQWSERFKNKIKEFQEELVKEVKKKLDEVIQLKNARKELDDNKTEFENKLLQQSKKLAEQLKDKAKDEELEKKFNSVWRGWVTELTANTKSAEDINLKEDQFGILQELGIESALIDESKRSGRYKNISVIPRHLDYVILKKHKSAFASFQNNFEKSKSCNAFNCEDEEQIKLLIDKIEEHSLKAIKSKPVATRGYTSTYLREVAKHVKEEVETFQSEWKHTLTNMFTVDLLLYVFEKAESWILESQMKFKVNNDPVTYLESKKTQYYNIFRSFCKGSSSVVVLGELICEKLKASTLEAVYNKTAIDLAGRMKSNYPAFNGNRLNMEKYMLKSLAEKEDFNDFITYIQNPRKQTEAFIKAEVEKYISAEHRNKAERILRQNVNDIIELVNQALSGATEKVQIQKGDTDMWLREFSSLLKGDVKFDTISSENFRDIKEFDFLRETIKKGLKSITEQMSSFNLDKMKESREKTDEILIRQLCSCCWVKCPFCAAVCTNTIEDHAPDDHSVPFHRMSGIKGWHYKDTVEMDIDFCTTNVSSNSCFYPRRDSEKTVPYKDYRTAGPEYACWKITADESKLEYWKWFVCKFQNQLEDHYKLKFQGRGEIPYQWRNISRSEAIKSLDQMCE